MTHTAKRLTRRRFIEGALCWAAAAAGYPSRTMAATGAPRRKTLLSFYCDDTGPYTAGPEAFETFLDYCKKQGIAGESSAILGASGKSMTRNPDKAESAYLEQLRRARECGIDTHMEIMTHRGRFDFGRNREPEGAQHEGVWLYEPAAGVSDYERYFGSILAEGERAGVRFTGFTWPGCSCEACQNRYAELREAGHDSPNPEVWQALLNLAKKARFESRTVPCFFDSSETDFALKLKARDGNCGVYNFMPNAEDKFGVWENDPSWVNADYYVTADGKSGILVRHVEEGSPYCLFYAHWQGLNPKNGVGWKAFTAVVERIKEHLAGRVTWMRPSQITDRYHAAGGWDFREPLADRN